MKNFLIAFLLLFSMHAVAQNFEGVIAYNIKTEITDPKMKAQMEEARKAMNDPAKRKEMEDQMNNPQFKAMMEQNPQMKAQMERAMAMMNGGGMESMVPKGVTVKIKNNNSLTLMQGGMMDDTDILYLKEKDQTILINRVNKTFSIRANSTVPTQYDPKVKVTRTTEKMKIQNYNCTKYVVEITEQGKAMTQYIWATPDIQGLDVKALARQQVNKGNLSLFYKDIDGFPIKVEMKTPEMNMTMNVIDIKKMALPASDFTIPAGFKELK